MHIKTGLFVGLCSLLLAGLTACIGGTEEESLIVSKDAQLVTFSLSHDSIPELAKAKFTIDQVDSRVYNHDSLPFLTDLTKFPRVKVTYTSGAGVSNLFINDSTSINSGDSIDISIMKAFIVKALDKIAKKTYNFSVNVHQIDPDSVQYSQVVSESSFAPMENKTFLIDGKFYLFENNMMLHCTTDMKQWQHFAMEKVRINPDFFQNLQASEEGFYSAVGGELYAANVNETTGISAWETIAAEYPVKAVLGYLYPTEYDGKIFNEGGLSLIVEKDGVNIFAFIKASDIVTGITAKPLNFKYGQAVPANFPLSGFSVLHNKSVLLNKITIIGSSSWTTEDGLYWVELSGNPQGALPSITSGTAFLYNNEIWFFGGKTGEEYNKEVYYSLDGGLVWKNKEPKAQAPEEFPFREDASIVTDKEGKYFYIIGGKDQAGIWKGVLNSRLFGD
ncbi:hypothetical protein AGMMS50262_15210 [Bacteroidia bacterium]|nr:hypothetical protein AGMMS50262_15210 [Bacteroidia bacterium]